MYHHRVQWWDFMNTAGFHKRQGTSRLVERLSASQEGLCSMELGSLSLTCVKSITTRSTRHVGLVIRF
jgi:hypothetical protein